MAGYYSQPSNHEERTYSPHNSPPRQRREQVVESDDNSEGKLFVGALAWESTEESIRDYFGKFGEVESVNLKKNKDDPTKHRGFAFVTFRSGEGADAVLSYGQEHIIDGSKVDPKSACPLGIKPEERTKKIFVGGLQTETTEEKLKEYFGRFGEIKNNIEFATDHVSKRRRGFCFIEFGSESVVDRIVKDRFHVVAGRKLETKRALSKQQQQQLSSSSAGVAGLQPRLGGAVLAYSANLPYAQPVLYIHPDSLSTAYPLSALGLATVPGMAPSYGAAGLYQSHSSKDPRQPSSYSRSSPNIRYDPYRK